MNTFEERLETELVRVVAARASEAQAVRKTWRRPAVRVGAVASVAAAAVAVPLVFAGGGGGTPAYAVVRHSDGSLTITVNDTKHPGELQSKLRGYGVNSQVTVDRICRTSPELEGALQNLIRKGDPAKGGNILTIDPRRLPSGALLVLGVFNGVPTGAPTWARGDVILALALVGKGDSQVCHAPGIGAGQPPAPSRS